MPSQVSLLKGGRGIVDTHIRESDVKMVAEIRVMLLQVKECQGLLAVEKAWNGFSPRASGMTSVDTWVWGYGPHNSEKIKLCCFRPPRLS